MIQIRRILFPTDFSRCADQALTHALYLAERYQAELHLLHAIVLHEDDPHNPAYHFPDIEEIYARLKENADARMINALEDLRVHELKIERAQLRYIAPAPAILHYADEKDIDLIVMGTHGRRGLGHMFLGSVAEETVRLSPCPVLTIREHKEPVSIKAIKKILVPVDFSDYAQQALTYAKELAAQYDAKLQLLHVIEEPLYPYFYVADGASIFNLIPDIEPKSEKHLNQLLEKIKGPSVPVETNVIKGRASRDIVKFSDENDTDLIVVATHGLTGIQHMILGSVTEKVVRMAKCPVFTVNAFGRTEV